MSGTKSLKSMLPPPLAKDDEHPALRVMRKKFESISENTMSKVEALNERIEQLAAQVSAHPPVFSEEDLMELDDDVILELCGKVKPKK